MKKDRPVIVIILGIIFILISAFMLLAGLIKYTSFSLIKAQIEEEEIN